MFGLKSLNTGTFFKDRQGLDSVSALLLFITWFPSTWVVLVTQSENLYYAYIAAFTGLAANKQWASRNANTNVNSEQLEADSDSPSDSVSGAARVSPSKPPVRKKRPY